MPTALITGANRGLGLAHARLYAERGWRVLAAARKPQEAEELAALAGAGDVRVLRYDAAEDGAGAGLRAEVGGEPIDVLLANAGVIGASDPSSGVGGGGAEQSFEAVSAAAMVQTFRINTVAPLLLARAFVENVAASDRKLIALQSSQMGSISDASGGYYAYRASKTALNMVAKAMAHDLGPRGIITISLHPGWVRTRMGGPSARIDAEESARGEQALFDRVTAADSGKFFRYSGEVLDW